jgi:hypothetical protein
MEGNGRGLFAVTCLGGGLRKATEVLGKCSPCVRREYKLATTLTLWP